MAIPNKYLLAAQDAQRRLDGGDARGAIHIGEQVLQALPNYTGLHVILGRAYRKTGQTDLAISRFRTAAELAKNDADRWFEFVDELLKSGQKGRARKVVQKVPLKGPEKKKLLDLVRSGGSVRTGASLGGVDKAELSNLQVLMQKGEAAQARKKALLLLENHPKSAYLNNFLGIVALAEGESENAAEFFRKTLELSPNFSGAAANLGLALTSHEEFGAAIDVLKKAIIFDPNSVEARTNLANAYLADKAFAEAADEAKELLKLAKNDPDGLNILSISYVRLLKFTEALSVIDQLEQVAERNEPTVIRRFEALSGAGMVEDALSFAQSQLDTCPKLLPRYGQLLVQLGRLDEAKSWLRKAISVDSNDFMAYYQYGSCARWSADDPMLPILKAAAERTEDDAENAKMVFYALAKAQLDVGQDSEGFAALHQANKLHGRDSVFDYDGIEARRVSIQSKWTPEVFDKLRGAGVENVAPIFIVGTPRSGSTLLEHIVAAHPYVSSIGEDSFAHPFFPLDMESERNVLVEASKSAAKEIRRLSGPEGILLDKYLGNFLRIGSLAAAFPNAKFIQTKRDPRAIALSIYSNPLRVHGHPYSNDLEDIARFYMHYQAFMAHWHNVLGDRIIVSDYQQLVEDPEPQIRSLIERLGLPWDDACLSPESVQKRVKTLSVVQVRSAIHSGSVERWKKHEADLEPFTKILRESGLI